MQEPKMSIDFFGNTTVVKLNGNTVDGITKIQFCATASDSGKHNMNISLEANAEAFLDSLRPSPTVASGDDWQAE